MHASSVGLVFYVVFFFVGISIKDTLSKSLPRSYNCRSKSITAIPQRNLTDKTDRKFSLFLMKIILNTFE